MVSGPTGILGPDVVNPVGEEISSDVVLVPTLSLKMAADNAKESIMFEEDVTSCLVL